MVDRPSSTCKLNGKTYLFNVDEKNYSARLLSPKTYFLCNYILKNTISVLPFFKKKNDC